MDEKESYTPEHFTSSGHFEGERMGTAFPSLKCLVHFRGLLCAKNPVNTPDNISNSQKFPGALNLLCRSTPVVRPSQWRFMPPLNLSHPKWKYELWYLVYTLYIWKLLVPPLALPTPPLEPPQIQMCRTATGPSAMRVRRFTPSVQAPARSRCSYTLWTDRCSRPLASSICSHGVSIMSIFIGF